jgi:hypothetical protein
MDQKGASPALEEGRLRLPAATRLDGNQLVGAEDSPGLIWNAFA